MEGVRVGRRGGNSSLHEVRGRCDGNDNMGRWLSCKETVSHERQ